MTEIKEDRTPARTLRTSIEYLPVRNEVAPNPPQELCPWDYAVKSWPAFFQEMINGRKRHDMRDKSERTYAVGDRVLLCEYDPFGGSYTGRSAIFKITYITSNDTPCAMSSNALSRDACILSVELLETFL